MESAAVKDRMVVNSLAQRLDSQEAILSNPPDNRRVRNKSGKKTTNVNNSSIRDNNNFVQTVSRVGATHNDSNKSVHVVYNRGLTFTRRVQVKAVPYFLFTGQRHILPLGVQVHNNQLQHRICRYQTVETSVIITLFIV